MNFNDKKMDEFNNAFFVAMDAAVENFKNTLRAFSELNEQQISEGLSELMSEEDLYQEVFLEFASEGPARLSKTRELQITKITTRLFNERTESRANELNQCVCAGNLFARNESEIDGDKILGFVAC